MEVNLEGYTSALGVLGVALLLVMAGLAKKQIAWRRVRSVPVRRRRLNGSEPRNLE
jgi:hypothetical protein